MSAAQARNWIQAQAGVLMPPSCLAGARLGMALLSELAPAWGSGFQRTCAQGSGGTPGSGGIESDGKFRGLVQHLALDLSDDMHLAGLAVKAQREPLLAVDELQRLGPDGALHARHALGLLGAQAHGVAHAVLGDHEADLAFLLVALVGSVDHLHAVARVEVAR